MRLRPEVALDHSSVTARSGHDPAASEAATNNVAGPGSISGVGGFDQTTSSCRQQRLIVASGLDVAVDPGRKPGRGLC